jgi:hypothetical protein
MRLVIALAVTVVAVSACKSKETPPATTPPAPSSSDKSSHVPLKPFEPLERVTKGAPDAGSEEEREAFFKVAPFEPTGPAVPEGAVAVEVKGESATVNGAAFDVASLKPEQPVVLVPDQDTYLAQAAGLLAKLDDAHAEVWLKHPEKPFAYKLLLRDEPSFQQWIDDPTPGKLRVIQRTDGYELQTNLGKLPGQDPNGPSVPVRGGKFDNATLQKGLEKVQKRFKEAPDLCFVPSFAMEVANTSRAMAANWVRPDASFFGTTCLVYPRPQDRDAGR